MPVPASRDRLARPVDISALLDKAPRRVNLIVDEPGLRRVGLSGYGFRNSPGSGGARGSLNQQRTAVGSQGTRTLGTAAARRSGGRGRGQLPSWYPRTPLRDITAIVRAIERRRAELGLNQELEAPREENNAQTEPDIGASTPIPAISVKPQLSPATQLWRMKAGNADWSVDSSDLVTPQKKLLDSIEKVREVWLKEQQKLERTPAAKRIEREKKVRVLLSMR